MIVIQKKRLKPKDGYKTVSIRVTTDMVHRLEQLCHESGQSRNQIINILLEQGIKKLKLSKQTVRNPNKYKWRDKMQYFGITLQALRENQGYTQKGLAEKLGVNTATIRRLETSMSFRPSITTLMAVANLFQLTLQELINLPIEPSLDIGQLSPQRQKLMCLLIMEFKGLPAPKEDK